MRKSSKTYPKRVSNIRKLLKRKVFTFRYGHIKALHVTLGKVIQISLSLGTKDKLIEKVETIVPDALDILRKHAVASNRLEDVLHIGRHRAIIHSDVSVSSNASAVFRKMLLISIIQYLANLVNIAAFNAVGNIKNRFDCNFLSETVHFSCRLVLQKYIFSHNFACFFKKAVFLQWYIINDN